jgi:signal transduction histidine kinase
MKRNVLIILLSLLFCGTIAYAQEAEKSDLQKRAEAVDTKDDIAKARSLYIQAYHDYASKGQIERGVECGVKASALYYRENFYQEAFDLLRSIDQNIVSASNLSPSQKSAQRYYTTKERMQMYIKMRRAASALDQLNIMENHAREANNETVNNDLLYNKAIYYYTFGQNAQGNAVFQEMANKLTAQKEYDKVDEVYQTLIANGRRSNNANLVAQSYSNYIAWKDSANAMKVADEIGALKQQIADNETVIAEKDSSLSARKWWIIALCVLVAALTVVLVLGAVVLLRFILLTRKQKKNITLLNESNALKSKFIGNISAQLEPTLQKLDSKMPEVKAMLDFSTHVQVLSELENSVDEPVELEETQIHQFCEDLMNEIREQVNSNVTLTVNAPKLSAKINREYVSHVLRHLLKNAAVYTPADGNIWLDFKKRSAHKFQFLVSNTGTPIPEEKRDEVFRPFNEVRDLTEGDGLGLPICKQMALKMKGDLDIDAEFTKGTRFVLHLSE